MYKTYTLIVSLSLFPVTPPSVISVALSMNDMFFLLRDMVPWNFESLFIFLWDTWHWELYISGYQAVFIPCCGMRLSDFSSVWSFRSLGFSLARTNPEMLYSPCQGRTLSSENFHHSSLYFFPFPFLLTLSSQFPTWRLRLLWRT